MARTSDRSMIIALAAVLAGTLAVAAPAQTASATPTLRYETVVSGLSHPWDVSFVGELLLFDERGGTVWSKRGSAAAKKMTISGFPKIFAQGESGLSASVNYPTNVTTLTGRGQSGRTRPRTVTATSNGSGWPASLDLTSAYSARALGDTWSRVKPVAVSSGADGNLVVQRDGVSSGSLIMGVHAYYNANPTWSPGPTGPSSCSAAATTAAPGCATRGRAATPTCPWAATSSELAGWVASGTPPATHPDDNRGLARAAVIPA